MITPADTPRPHVAARGPVTRAVRQADDGIGSWLVDLVSGAGSSPGHIIVTGILGVVPGVGQVMDVRDLILGIIVISKSPSGVGGWVDLAITLIGCVPAIGDALKVGFKLMKQGRNFGRVLEAVSPALRGNVEVFMRKIDWNMLIRESQGLLHKTMDAFIDGLDSWAVKALAGRSEVNAILAELRALQKKAPNMIASAFEELKKMHGAVMGHPLPGTTAALTGTSGKVVRAETRQIGKTVGKEAKLTAAANAKRKKTLLAKKNKDATSNRAAPNGTKNNKKKAAKKKDHRNKNGVLAEHLTDYYVKKKHPTYPKVNELGRLTEEFDKNRTGIDHIWMNQRHEARPYIVADTKSSLYDSFSLIMALPGHLREQFNVLRADEKANPLPRNDPTLPRHPDIFSSDKRDALANQHVKIKDSRYREEIIKGGVNKADPKTGLDTQMSHAWIARALSREKLTAEGKNIFLLLTSHRRKLQEFPATPFPYYRWISLVTGRQFEKHRKSRGSTHDIQIIIDIPNNILLK